MTQPREHADRSDDRRASAVAPTDPDPAVSWPPAAYEDREWTYTIDQGHLGEWQRHRSARSPVPPRA